MVLELTNKVALITGGRRIGLVVAGQLAARGVDVVLGYARSRDEAEQAARSVRAAGRRAEVVQADVSQPAACQALVGAAAEKLGRIDILINMASVYVRHPFDDLTAADWDGTLNVDLRGSFLCALAAAPHMRRQGGGRIINFSDWTARKRAPALSKLSSLLRGEGGSDRADRGAGARARRRQHPGERHRARADSRRRRPSSDEDRHAVEQATPLGRWGGEIEIAKAVLALLDADFITGETLRVDGGRHLK